MMKFSIRLTLGLSMTLAASVRAQMCDPLRPMSEWQATIETLAAGEEKASMATPGLSETARVAARADEWAQHGFTCLIAAGRARELSNPKRMRALLTEARASLVAARARLTARDPGLLRSRAAYYLGQMAQDYEQDLPRAERLYQEAIDLDATNQQARNALERVQAYLAFRRTLKG